MNIYYQNAVHLQLCTNSYLALIAAHSGAVAQTEVDPHCWPNPESQRAVLCDCMSTNLVLH